MTHPEPALRGALLDLLGLVLPVSCGLCGRRDRSLCPGCARRLHAQLAPGPARGLRAAGVPVYAAGRYSGSLRRLILLAKDAGRRDLLRPLGAVLGLALRAAGDAAGGGAPAAAHRRSGRGPVALVAVPSRRASERERGYRHVEILARLAVRAASDPSGPPPRSAPPDLRLLRALRTGAGRADQVGLGRAERLANARRTEVRPGSRAALAGRRVWLVDDLATTGASLDGARRALRAAGARAELAVVCAAVVARADPAS